MKHLHRRAVGMKTALQLAAVVGALGAISVAPAPASARPRLFAASDEAPCLAGQNVNAFLSANHANVMRVILSPYWPTQGALSCIQAAYAANYRIYISVQFSNRWTPRQDASYFGGVLRAFAPFVWAVGVGNEQDLPLAVLPGQRHEALTGTGYRSVWNAVEPVIASVAPHAIRVYGDLTPWAFAATEQGFAHGRPRGVQAIAAHCYHTKIGGLMQIPALAAWAARKRLPLWCSEMGPALPAKTTPAWAIPESRASWNRAVARIIARSPDLKMTSYYQFPGL